MSGLFRRGRSRGARSGHGTGSGFCARSGHGARSGLCARPGHGSRSGVCKCSGRTEHGGRGARLGRARIGVGAWLVAGVLALCLGSTALAQSASPRPVAATGKGLQKHDGRVPAPSRTHPLRAALAETAKGNGARFGVEPVSARLAMGGHLVAFRYRVVDAKKAKALFHDGIQPVLIDARTGGRVSMPTDTKMGALRSSPRSRPTEGKQYYVLFGNPVGAIRHGSEISVAMGGCKLEGVVVE